MKRAVLNKYFALPSLVNGINNWCVEAWQPKKGRQKESRMSTRHSPIILIIMTSSVASSLGKQRMIQPSESVTRGMISTAHVSATHHSLNIYHQNLNPKAHLLPTSQASIEPNKAKQSKAKENNINRQS
ncbi:hypothetical protein CR513_33362, partial [Mucuna pruriens]